MNRWLLGAGLMALMFFANTSDAEAKLVLWGYGDSIMKVAEVSPETKKRLELMSKIVRARRGRSLSPDQQIGFKYSYFSLFFMNMWTWKGSFVLFHKRTYISLTPKRAKFYKIDVSKLSKPFGYKFPTGILVLIGGIIVLVIFGAMSGPDEDEQAGDEAERMLAESRQG